MLTVNVLCLKKKKKRTYCLSSATTSSKTGCSKGERSRRGTVTMMQITEDTPPDMLAGAMDLTVHLPNGKSVKMSVERSTPMMDLLVQITTANHLQLSNYTLQVMGMMSSSTEHSNKVLPFKPNTPIGTLDTQHIKVLPKSRTLPVSKYIAPGHQPFESTFRLKVYLPRNQLYVTRVSRNVQLEEIMKKVCEEKNLDPVKYDFKHPANLDEVLNPKLTLNDYQITEIYVVAKGTNNLSQTFSSADIMALRKEEERKQMHSKTGGGVLNLIFKRGKSSMGSGSVSSENRSISPTQSDDSRSVTPPAAHDRPIVTPPLKNQPPDKPRPPQRKRRPAPKPPQIQTTSTSSVVSGEDPTEASAAAAAGATVNNNKRAIENGLTICHSRNSSDSSGYHEASILSDHCAGNNNTSLPRTRPKSAFVGDVPTPQNSSNLSKMAAHSVSTTSLVSGRKKKPAPPPPPITVSPPSSIVAPSLKPPEKPSPLVASQTENIATTPELPEVVERTPTNSPPVPKPRNKYPKAAPRSRPQSELLSDSSDKEEAIERIETKLKIVKKDARKEALNKSIVDDVVKEALESEQPKTNNENRSDTNDDYSMEDILASLETMKPFIMNTEQPALVNDNENVIKDEPNESPKTTVVKLQKSIVSDIFSSQEFLKDSKAPAIVGVIPKTPKEDKKFDSFGKKRLFQIGSSLEQQFDPETASRSSRNSVSSALNALDDLDETMFTGSLSKASTKKRPEVFNQLFGMYSYESNGNLERNISVSSLPVVSDDNVAASLKKWDNTESLNTFAVVEHCGVKNRWVTGDASNSELITSTNLTSTPDTTKIPPPSDTTTPERLQAEEKSFESTDSGIAQDNQSDQDNKESNEEEFEFGTPPLLPAPIADDILDNKGEEEPLSIPVLSKKAPEKEEELTDVDWQYQLPSPPKAFRDSSPTNFVENETNSLTSDFKDSVVTSPELFEKLRTLEDTQSEKEVKSEVTSIASEEPLNTLSLENLEKRKSLVYNRELTTSLKMTDSIESSIKTTSTTTLTNASRENFSSTIQPTKPSRNVGSHHTLPNFKITTYDVPKHKNIKVFEDDTIRSNSQPKPLTRSQWGHSMENISFSSPRRSFDDYSNIKDKEYKFYKPQSNLLLSPSSSMVSRSGSFSTEARSPSKPSVSRSKSTLVLNKYQSAMRREQPGMSRSSSLFDVSGLQSLEVMKLIRDKLSTPTGSVENLKKPEDNVQSVVQIPPPKIIDKEQHPSVVAPEPKPEPPTKKYYYRGPPAVNMSTWSERPKIPVAVKEDEDYKLGNVSSKLIVNTTSNNLTSNNSVEVKSANEHSRQNVTVNINNETEQITQKSGNVIIKIGGGARINNTGPVYRQRQQQQQPRPHSIALPSDFDGSRVPVVRSVELKKPYKEASYGYNTSVTHLNQGNEELFVGKFKRNSYSSEDYGTKTFRVSSFKPLAAPAVRGFRPPTEDNVNNIINNNNNINNRMSWQQNEKDYGTNQHVPFSRSTLKRTESSKLYNNKVEETPAPITRSPTIVNHPPQHRQNQRFVENDTFTEYHSLPTTLPTKIRQSKAVLSSPAPPPPPPQMPKVTLRKVPPRETSSTSMDPRGQLLEAIRNFGGKKGLRAVNA